MYTSAIGLSERDSLPPHPVTDYYKPSVDRTLLREHLKLTPQQRLEKLVAFMRSLDALSGQTRVRHDVRFTVQRAQS